MYRLEIIGVFLCSENIRAFFMPIFKEVRVVANRIKGITVEIGGDTTGLDKALKSVNSSITKTQSALNDVNRLLKLDPSNTVLVRRNRNCWRRRSARRKKSCRRWRPHRSRWPQPLPVGISGRINIRRSSGRLRKPVES